MAAAEKPTITAIIAVRMGMRIEVMMQHTQGGAGFGHTSS
jgi:hypothetical protein